MSVATHFEMLAPPQPRMMVRLARPNPCHDNLAVVGLGRGPHAGGLRCAKCGKWRGWIAAAALEALVAGVPAELPVSRTMPKQPKPAPAKNSSAGLGGGARQHEGFVSDEIPFSSEWRG